MPGLIGKLELNKVYNMDCLQLMNQIPDDTIALIIADPPYYHVKGKFDFVWETESKYLEWMTKCLYEFRRILAPTGTLMLWGGIGKGKTTLCRLAIIIEDLDLFKLQNWITQRNTRGIGTKSNYMSAREELMFYTKSDKYTFNVPYTEEKSNRKDLGANGKPRKNEYKRVSNVWCDIAEDSQSSRERCEHPTVKAQKLCDRIITTHSNWGDLVYIPFAGAGSEIASCINNEREYLASEIEPKYIELIHKRVPVLTGMKV